MKKNLVFLLVICMVLSAGLVACGSKEPTAKDVTDMVELSNWAVTSGVPNNKIKINFDDADAKVVLSTEKVGFWVSNAYAKTATVSVGQGVSWNMANEGTAQEKAYIEVRIKSGDNIVGYALIKAVKNTSSAYDATVVKSVIFPKVDGAYQTVSDAQVTEIINKLKV